MKTLSAEELKRMRDTQEDMVLINVLSEEDFQKVHIPDSENVPVDRRDFAEQVEKLAGGKDRTVVVYCTSFDCEASPTAARKLDEAGFINVYDFAGGLQAWLKAGFDVARPAGSRL